MIRELLPRIEARGTWKSILGIRILRRYYSWEQFSIHYRFPVLVSWTLFSPRPKNQAGRSAGPSQAYCPQVILTGFPADFHTRNIHRSRFPVLSLLIDLGALASTSQSRAHIYTTYMPGIVLHTECPWIKIHVSRLKGNPGSPYKQCNHWCQAVGFVRGAEMRPAQ